MLSGLMFTKQCKRPTGAALDILRSVEGASVICKNHQTAPHVLRGAESPFVIRKNTHTLPNVLRGAEGASTNYKND